MTHQQPCPNKHAPPSRPTHLPHRCCLALPLPLLRFGIRGLDVTFGPYTTVNSQGLPWTLANGGSIPHSVLSSLTTAVQPDGPLLLPLPLQPPAATAPHPPPPSLPLRPAADEPVSSPEQPGSWPKLTSPAPTSPYPYPSPNTYPSPSPDPTPSDLTTTFSIIIGVMAGLAVTGLLLCYVAPTCLRSTAAAKDSELGPHPTPSPASSNSLGGDCCRLACSPWREHLSAKVGGAPE
ncbi:hypothetical protein V8C86DRAFT_1356875 [Haematococcus lacustris]